MHTSRVKIASVLCGCVAFVLLDFSLTSASALAQEQQLRSTLRPTYSHYPASRLGRDQNQRVNSRLLRVFRSAMGTSWKASVRLSAEGSQVALGTIVDPDGWIVTKASQVAALDEVTCQLWDYREVQAQVVRRSPEMDLALLRVPTEDLPLIRWSFALPTRGNWVATADLKETPTAIGVVSTGAQRIFRSDSVLGVELEPVEDGARVSRVVPGTGAYAAGLRVRDVIYQVNGAKVYDLSSFRTGIQGLRGGDVIRLKFTRRDKNYSVDARLMDLTEELLDESEMEVNGYVSARATDFERVFLHDTVLLPNQCGGPLVNLRGEVVGINIARAGRVTSYAIPSDVLKPLIDGMIAEAKLVSRNADAKVLPPDQIR